VTQMNAGLPGGWLAAGWRTRYRSYNSVNEVLNNLTCYSPILLNVCLVGFDGIDGRFAPGFRDCILARHKMNAADLEKSNLNLAVGDINGGAANLMQLIARPILSRTPYRTPLRGVYLCSASTPPGGGVHGMCGYHAARLALREIFAKQ